MRSTAETCRNRLTFGEGLVKLYGTIRVTGELANILFSVRDNLDNLLSHEPLPRGFSFWEVCMMDCLLCPYCQGSIKIIAHESEAEINTTPIQIKYGIHVLFVCRVYNAKSQKRPRLSGFWTDTPDNTWYIGEIIRGTCLENAIKHAEERLKYIIKKYGGEWFLDEDVHPHDNPDDTITVDWKDD